MVEDSSFYREVPTRSRSTREGRKIAWFFAGANTQRTLPMCWRSGPRPIHPNVRCALARNLIFHGNWKWSARLASRRAVRRSGGQLWL